MINMPAHKNTENPAGQIVYRPVQGLYLRDIIARIQDHEEIREDEFDGFPFGIPEEVYLELIGKDNE